MYEYYCRPCNEKFTKRRPMSASAEPFEHDCGSVAQKVLTAAVVTVAGEFSDIEAAEANAHRRRLRLRSRLLRLRRRRHGRTQLAPN